MKRRKYLSLFGVVTAGGLAGCSGSPSTSGDDSDPFDRTPESFIPEPSFYGDNWEGGEVTAEEESSASAEFVNFDSSNQIVNGVTVYDSAEAARNAYAEQYQSEREDASADEVTVENASVAVESYYYQISIPRVTFRDANVIGRTTFVNFSGNQPRGSPSRAQQLAATWHETWRN